MPVDKRYQLNKLSKAEMFEKAMQRVREQAEFLHKANQRDKEKKLPTEIVDN